MIFQFKLTPQIGLMVYVMGMLVLNSCATVHPLMPGHHTVQTGETLYTIAASYNQNVHELADWNNIPWPYFVVPNSLIRVERPANYQSLRLKFYETVPGDTWEKVANHEKQLVSSLKDWNNGMAPECCFLPPGLKLLVSAPVGYNNKGPFAWGLSTPGTKKMCPSNLVTVKKGATWYGVTVRQCGCQKDAIDEMQVKNGARILQPGQKICCYCKRS